MTTASSIAVPTKTERDESFPVAWLLPARLRAPVLTYYAFARKADDAADSSDLTAEEKLARLDALESGLMEGSGDPAGVALRAVMTERGLDLSLARTLLDAFRRDVQNPRCETWGDLMEYCRLSAMPVGRFLLAVSEEPPTDAKERAADALCAALQVLNHAQDCGEDWRVLGRTYIPSSWLAEAEEPPSALAADRCSPGLRLVLDRVLANTDGLLQEAAALPGLLTHRRLRMQAAATLSLARSLRRRLALQDPLAVRVTPARPDWGRAFMRALRAGISR